LKVSCSGVVLMEERHGIIKPVAHVFCKNKSGVFEAFVLMLKDN
jgi:hypothetical protein